MGFSKQDEEEYIYERYGVSKTGIRGEDLTEYQRQQWLSKILKEKILKGLMPERR